MTDYSGYGLQGFATGLASGFDIGSRIREMKWRENEQKERKKMIEEFRSSVDSFTKKNEPLIDEIIQGPTLKGGFGTRIQGEATFPIPPPATFGTSGAAAFPTGGATSAASTLATQVPTVPVARTPVGATGQATATDVLGQAITPETRGVGSQGILASPETLNLVAAAFAISDSAGQAFTQLALAIDHGDREAVQQYKDYIRGLTEVVTNLNVRGIAVDPVTGLKDIALSDSMRFVNMVQAVTATPEEMRTPTQLQEMYKAASGSEMGEIPKEEVSVKDYMATIQGIVDIGRYVSPENLQNLKDTLKQKYGVDLGFITSEAIQNVSLVDMQNKVAVIQALEPVTGKLTPEQITSVLLGIPIPSKEKESTTSMYKNMSDRVTVVGNIAGLYTWDRKEITGSNADEQRKATTRRFHADKPALVAAYGADIVNEVESTLIAQDVIEAGPIPVLIDSKGGTTPDVFGYIPGGTYMYKGHKLQYRGNNQWIDVTGGS